MRTIFTLPTMMSLVNNDKWAIRNHHHPLVDYILSSIVSVNSASDITTSSAVNTIADFINKKVCSSTAAVGVIVSSSAASSIHDEAVEPLIFTHKQVASTYRSTVNKKIQQSVAVATKPNECLVESDTVFNTKPLEAEKQEKQRASQYSQSSVYGTQAVVRLDNQTSLNGITLLATCPDNLVASSSSSLVHCVCHSLCKDRLSSLHVIITNLRFKTSTWLSGSTLRNFLVRKFCVLAASVEDTNDHVNSSSISGAKLHRFPTNSTPCKTGTGSKERKDSQQQSSTPSYSPSSTVTTPAPESSRQKATQVPESATMKEERQLEFILKSLVAGGVAGMCAKTTVAPLDRMKILLQAHSKHYSHLGVFSGLRGIVEKERFLALYKGNGAQMVRIFPYAATQFTSFEMYKKLFGEESHIGRFGAGSAAGVTAVALTYPLDTIRARLAFQVTGEHVYTGIYSCATHILREEGGIRALYRGFIPTVCGMIPYAGLSFYCFESFKYICMKYFPTYTCKRHSTNTGGLVLLLYAKLLCGGVAGAAAQTVAYPLDVTRRRMQLAMMDEKTKKFGMGMVSTIKLIYQENGIMRGLYRGMSINYLRAIPMVAVSFSTYELVKQMLRLDTGLPIKTG